MRGYFRTTILNEDKHLQSYVIGLALGDGNLSNPSPHKKVTRLRITCDKKYPFLIQKIINSLQILLPQNKVSIVDRAKGYLDVSVYSNHLENLLEWKAKSGSKFVQSASVPSWIKKNSEYKINCLRRLIETDGSIYYDRGYKMMIFTTIIPNLANDFQEMIISLGFDAHLYKISNRANPYNFNQQTLYHVRLSKNVSEFLELVKPQKL